MLGDWTRAYWVRDSYGCLRTTEIQEIGAKKFPYSLLMKIASKSKFVVASTNPTCVQWQLVMELRPGFFKVRIPDWVRTLRWITRFFPDPLFEDFHKLSAEKEILKIGQDLTELDVNLEFPMSFKISSRVLGNSFPHQLTVYSNF